LTIGAICGTNLANLIERGITMRHIHLLLSVIILLVSSANAVPGNTLDQVHLLQSFFNDAIIAPSPYTEGFWQYGSDRDFSAYQLGVQGGFPVLPQLEIGAALGYRFFDPDCCPKASGLSDLLISSRYQFTPQDYKISAGGYLTIPIGAEKIGQNNFDIGGFGALRYPLGIHGLVATGNLGIELVESYNFQGKKSRELSLLIGCGLLVPLTPDVTLIGEVLVRSERDYALLSGGIDVRLPVGHLRGGLGIGMDDGVPDVLLMLSYLVDLSTVPPTVVR
jgi:hypothetical protein